MASSWGLSWYNSWGNSWGVLTPDAITIGNGIFIDGVFGSGFFLDKDFDQGIYAKQSALNINAISARFTSGEMRDGLFSYGAFRMLMFNACAVVSSCFGVSLIKTQTTAYNVTNGGTFGSSVTKKASFGSGVSRNEQY